MMRIVTPAIVLSSREMRESDLVVEAFTERLGRIAGVAKGAKRSKRRFVNTFDIGTLIAVTVYRPRGGDFFLIEEASLIDSFSYLSTDVSALAYASAVLELVREFTPEGEPSPDIFTTVVSYLSKGNRGSEGKGFFFIYMTRLLKQLGISPLFSACVRCSRPNPTESGGLFIPSTGGMVCERCLKPHDRGVPLSSGSVKILATALTFPPERLSRIQVSVVFCGEIQKALFSFIHYQLGKRMKSLDFIERYTKNP
jgi:DNA repair protein RecO (recombination protein O)